MADAPSDYEIVGNNSREFSRPSVKRQRIAVACDPCRARKVKCNGERPICDVCRRRRHKRGANCRYTAIQKHSLGSSAAEGRGEQGRLNDLELRSPGLQSAVYGVFGTDSLLDTYGATETSTPTGARVANAPQPQDSDIALINSTPTSNNDRLLKKVAERSQVSHTEIDNDSRSQGFFGSSSADSFITQVTSVIDRKAGVHSPETTYSISSVITSTLEQGGRKSADTTGNHVSKSSSFVLPARKTADHLIGVYWKLVYPIYPFLDRQSFEKAYKSVWDGSYLDTEENILLSTLNMVFALGSQLSDSIRPEDREEAAEKHFRHARELLQTEMWDTDSVELVQCLLLMGEYLHSANAPHAAFMVVGQAIRVAQALGFHLTGVKFDRHSIHDRELARIIWHGCVMMDRIVSMTFGRPPMISSSVANHVPLPAESELISRGSSPNLAPLQQSSQPRMIKSFFVRSLQLYGIINEILLALYSPQEEERDQFEQPSEISTPYQRVDFATILRLDQALMTWSSKLPPHLQLPQPESTSNTITQRQALVCRIRFQHARITLLRPVLVEVCGTETSLSNSLSSIDDSLTQSLALQCARICLHVAHDTIQLVYSYLGGEAKSNAQLSEWWFSIFYLNTAATVLLAARLQPKVEACVPEYSIDTSLSQALEILKKFQPFGKTAKRASAALEVLISKIRQHESESAGTEGLGEQALIEPRLGNLPPNIFEDDVYGFGTGEMFDFNGIDFNLNDMSWISSLPSRL